jgi:hypothetical protein
MSNKVCLIAARNLSNITPLLKYISAAEDPIDIIYWNRNELNESCEANRVFAYNRKTSEDCSKAEKLLSYLGFRHFVLKILRRNKYDKIILLPTQTAVMLFDFLVVHHKKCKYLLDIQDYTAEYKKWFKPIINTLIKYSTVVSLTSPAYMSFLPIHEYIISHNYSPMPKSDIAAYRSRVLKGLPITISCVGGIRFIEYFAKIIQVFANDSRFVLRFDGAGSERLKPICKELSASNVILTGRFDRKDTIFFNMKADIANNLFGNHTPLLDFALSNRLYNAVQLGMPILVCPDTYTAQIACEYGFGFVFDIDDPACKEKLFVWYQSLDHNELYAACDRFLDKVKKDDAEYFNRIKDFLCRG